MAVQLYQNGGSIQTTATAFTYPAPTTVLTFMSWIRADTASAWSTPVTSMVGVYGPTAPTTAMQMGCKTANRFDCWTWGGNTLVNSVGWTPVVNTWYHFAVTSSGTGTFQLYINGVLNNTATATQLGGNLTQFYINGYVGSGTGETGNISVDDVMLFNRLLSGNEIMTIYMARGFRDGIVQNLISRYTFDEGYPGQTPASLKDEAVTNAYMYPNAATPGPIYTAPIAMSNLRMAQG